MVATVFTEITTGIASFLPALAKGIFDAFASLFLLESSGTYTINPLGSFAIVALVIGICYKVLPLAYNFIVKRSRARRARKARA